MPECIWGWPSETAETSLLAGCRCLRSAARKTFLYTGKPDATVPHLRVNILLSGALLLHEGNSTTHSQAVSLKGKNLGPLTSSGWNIYIPPPGVNGKVLTLQMKHKGSQEDAGVLNSAEAFHIRCLLETKRQGPYVSSQQLLGWKNSTLYVIQGCLGEWRILPGGLKDYGALGIWQISLITLWLRLSPSAPAQMLMGDSCPAAEVRKSAGFCLAVFLL